MKIKGLIILLFVGIVVWAKVSSNEKFSLAKDLPNGALVYLQTDDLPQLIKLWDDSKLNETYLESQNFKEFQNSHLGIKLAERFADFQTSIGFSLELSTLSGLAEKRAAIAIYDIGKLDFVFVAPMNYELFSATMFSQNSTKFTESKLEDGTSFYQIEFKVDRERQNQKLIFANIKSRFVLATNDKLFLQTISAMNGKQKLYDEASFKKLSERIVPNLVTIWVNQEKLNADYYFRRYWLMSKVEDLQNIKAGIFDLNLDEKGLTEKREFLLKEPQKSARISNAEARDLIAKVPEDVSFYRLQKIDEKQLGEVIYNTFFDKQIIKKLTRKRSYNWNYNDSSDYNSDNYEYLDSDFDEAINETNDDKKFEVKPFESIQISASINSVNPSVILTASSPKILENPLFAEFRKVAIISLNNPHNFQSNHFENSVIEALKNRVIVADKKFIWESENNLRKLKVPMLGWEIGYVLKDDKLFIANSFECLQSFVSTQNNLTEGNEDFDDFTVIKLLPLEADFIKITELLTTKSNDFFAGNIGSLFSVVGDVSRIEIRKKNENLVMSVENNYINR